MMIFIFSASTEFVLTTVPFHCPRESKSYRGRSDGVLRRFKRANRELAAFLSPLVGVPSGTPKTYRSLLLAVSSSTINKPSEYMIL